jgi:putative membrane protein
MKKMLWLFCFFAVFTWSAIAPHDRFTWFLEVAPAIIGIMAMALTWKKFPLTDLVYILVLLHSIILMVGGHYTYAEVPLFNDIKEWLHSSRNNFDKLGHFAQGFVPAMIVREIVIRNNIIPLARWRSFFIVCFCLAFSAFYELVEWWVALATGGAADAFLGTQGYVWDTQSDMAFALFGALSSLLVLGKLHDRQIQHIANR